ncbi:MAG: ornithine cyclodeaminase family protein, partial [Chloroflexota bacterium]
MQLRVLSASDVRQGLPMPTAIEGMKAAYAQVSAGQADVPLRSHVQIPAQSGVSLIMPAYLSQTNDLAVKVVSVFPNNPQRNQPTIYAAVLALDAETGRPLALLEGGALTAIRTGAASGAATDVLANPTASVAAIFGSGVQARTQLEAICAVRPIESIRLYSLNRAQARAFADELIQNPKSKIQNLEVVDSPAAAVRGADIICTATTSTTPVFDGRDLQVGAHVNAIGSFRPTMQEVDVETIRRSWVVVDSRPAALAEAGDLIIPLTAGEITLSHVHAELGEIINGDKPGRTSADQITYFKSVGLAAQDAVAARL